MVKWFNSNVHTLIDQGWCVISCYNHLAHGDDCRSTKFKMVSCLAFCQWQNFSVFFCFGRHGCKHLNAALMVFALLNYQPLCYSRPWNKLNSITQQIIGWQSVSGNFDIPIGYWENILWGWISLDVKLW